MKGKWSTFVRGLLYCLETQAGTRNRDWKASCQTSFNQGDYPPWEPHRWTWALGMQRGIVAHWLPSGQLVTNHIYPNRKW